MLAALVSLVLLLADAPPADLHGKVVGPDGHPNSGATAQVYSVTPKKGDATIKPTDHPDCEKSGGADTAGAFVIPAVDKTMFYEILVSADGFRPTLLKKVDPGRGDITAKLTKPPADVE